MIMTQKNAEMVDWSPVSSVFRLEWALCEIQAENRNDFLNPCARCRGHLAIQGQAILICSNVFSWIVYS